jgi:arginine exporter protein ArgO
MLWQCSLAFAVNSAKKILKSRALVNGMEGVTGMVLILLGTKLLLSENKV